MKNMISLSNGSDVQGRGVNGTPDVKVSPWFKFLIVFYSLVLNYFVAFSAKS